MTSYLITLGYNSSGGKERNAQELLRVVRALQDNPERLKTEVSRHHSSFSREDLDAWAAAYAHPVKDQTLEISEETDDRGFTIRQLASGGGLQRQLKEAFRRAFCRLVIEDMHALGIEVNFGVF